MHTHTHSFYNHSLSALQGDEAATQDHGRAHQHREGIHGRAGHHYEEYRFPFFEEKKGELRHIDFRSASKKENHDDVARDYLRIISWNIERGYHVKEIIEVLKKLQPDIILLQEADMYNERTGNLDIAAEIAKALEMNHFFVTEFEELRHKARTPRLQGGGCHGNAILTRFDMEDMRAVPHKHLPYDWETKGIQCKQPRKGQRVAASCVIKTGSKYFGDICAYSTHLECYTGIKGRVKQFFEIIQDYQTHYSRQQQQQPDQQHQQQSSSSSSSSSSAAATLPFLMIGGDLNTLSHGIARLLPFFSDSETRWSTLGLCEAEWWDKNLFATAAAPAAEIKTTTTTSSSSSSSSSDWLEQETRTYGVQLPIQLLDPFHKVQGATWYQYMGFVKAKYDWILVDSRTDGSVVPAEIINKEIGGAGLSDHMYLFVDIKPHHHHHHQSS